MSPAASRSSARRSKRFVGWVLGAAAMLATTLVAAEAEASNGRALGSTAFGAPRLSWNMAPPLHLQPESARLVLYLPSEWMPPAPRAGSFGNLILDPNKHWEFRRATRLTRATIGTSVHLHINDPARSIDFGLSLLPRAAIAVLRFDPLARWD
jgi:hypothetical protein